MKRLLIFLCSASLLFAHDHIEVGLDDDDRLAFAGPAVQLALYVPAGAFFSGDTPNFPGGYFANELTFTTEVNVLAEPTGAAPQIELISITGPAGAEFAFWEAGAASPTFSLPTGWTTSEGNARAFPVIAGGNNHVHGRIFTATKAGTYQVTVRAVDSAGIYNASADRTITFQVLTPPQLRIALQGDRVRLTFQSRPGLSYEIQSTTDLASGHWTPSEAIDPLDGNGGILEATEPLSNRPRVFYRLIEYR